MLVRNPPTRVYPEYAQIAREHPTWEQLTAVSPEIAGMLMGVTAGQAEMKQREARKGQTRAGRIAEAVADFERSQFGKDTPTGMLHRLIINKPVQDTCHADAA